MRFCDKLPKLRKENNLSQEQLADKLGVSRQAVSKWESGASYPDMDKIITLCKILNCSLDQLIDDGTMKEQLDNQAKTTNFNINIYIKEMLDFITKTANMFWSMRLIEKIKCILEMGFILLLIIIIYLIIGTLLYQLLFGVFQLLPNYIYNITQKIGAFLYSLFSLAVGAIVFIHIFKIRYLDYFITIEDPEVSKKSIEKPVDDKEEKKSERSFIEKNKNKIIIRDPKHTTYSFFYFLAKAVLMFLKFMAIICLGMALLSMVFLVIIEVFSIIYIKYGIIFVGTTIATTGCIAINYLILELLYNFIFNQKHHFKRTFIIFIISIILTGIGIGMSICAYLTYKKPEYNSNRYKVEIREIEYKENLTLNINHSNVELVSDNSIDNIRIEFTIPKSSSIQIEEHTSNYDDEESLDETNSQTTKEFKYYYWYLDYYFDSIDGLNTMLDHIKNKELIGKECYKVKIYANDNTIKLLKENHSKYH